MKLYVACAVCSVRRAHGAGYGRAEHFCSRGEPLGVRGLLLNAQGDVMAALMASKSIVHQNKITTHVQVQVGALQCRTINKSANPGQVCEVRFIEQGNSHGLQKKKHNLRKNT